MKIIGIQYTLKMKALEIYTSGCKGLHCKGCHNLSSWDFDDGEDYSYLKIWQKVKENDFLIDNIMIFGGEPLDNSHEEVLLLLNDLKKFNKKIWLFTRYDLIDIKKDVKELCDYIKCGRYIDEKHSENNEYYGIKLASSNQIIYKKGKDF